LEAFLRIVKPLIYIFSGIETFLSYVRLSRNLSVAFIKPIAAEAFGPSPALFMVEENSKFSSSDHKFWQ
jgi:hypothetical protein